MHKASRVNSFRTGNYLSGGVLASAYDERRIIQLTSSPRCRTGDCINAWLCPWLQRLYCEPTRRAGRR